ESGPINHRVELLTIKGFFREDLDLDPCAELDVADWLTIPQQKLRTINAGAIFHDDLQLSEIRAKFTWYPHDVWLYLLASEWSQIGQEEPFVGRTGYCGDEVGSQFI